MLSRASILARRLGHRTLPTSTRISAKVNLQVQLATSHQQYRYFSNDDLRNTLNNMKSKLEEEKKKEEGEEGRVVKAGDKLGKGGGVTIAFEQRTNHPSTSHAQRSLNHLSVIASTQSMEWGTMELICG